MAVKIAYRGDGYHGFQRQPGINTVENDILRILGRSKCINPYETRDNMYSAASRTDKGVHALGQTISFITACSPPLILEVINESLYPRMVAWAYRIDPHGEFKAREWCLARIYAYLLPRSLPEGFSERLRFFEGYLDYGWLTPVESGRNRRRRIYSASTASTRQGFLAIIVGESFLKQQVRRMIAYALGSCRGLDDCRLPPPSNLVLIDTLYPFSFKPVEEALELLVKMASPVPPLKASLGLVLAGYVPPYKLRHEWEQHPSMLQHA